MFVSLVRTADQVSTMWPGNNNRTEDEEEEEEEDSLEWSIVSKKKSRERSWKKMRTVQTDRDSLPTILETCSDNEAYCSSGSAEDEDWRATSLSPAASPLLRALIKPSSSGPGVSGDRTQIQTKQQHMPVMKPPIQTNSHYCRHDAAGENNTVCPLAMKLENIKDKVSTGLLL